MTKTRVSYWCCVGFAFYYAINALDPSAFLAALLIIMAIEDK